MDGWVKPTGWEKIALHVVGGGVEERGDQIVVRELRECMRSNLVQLRFVEIHLELMTAAIEASGNRGHKITP